jgi:hypothetical protein
MIGFNFFLLSDNEQCSMVMFIISKEKKKETKKPTKQRIHQHPYK